MYVYALVLVVQFNNISKCPTTYIVLYVIVAENLGRRKLANQLCYNFGEISLANCC